MIKFNHFAKKRCETFKGEKTNSLLSSKNACYHSLFQTIEYFLVIPWIRKRINHQVRQCYFNDKREKKRNIRTYESWYCGLLYKCTFITRVIQIQVRVEGHLIIQKKNQFNFDFWNDQRVQYSNDQFIIDILETISGVNIQIINSLMQSRGVASLGLTVIN